jgi:signal transduction histidine kinase
VVEEHGGKISVESSGKTMAPTVTFKIVFPIEP